MTNIIAVCTREAHARVGEIVRLLEAEGHRVRVIAQRHDRTQMDAVEYEDHAILLVWSMDAPSTNHMQQWLHQSDPSYLVEIATAPGWPERKNRKAAVIDFSKWRGERGRSWSALTDRLNAVEKVINPPEPPVRQAAGALGVVSMVAVAFAVSVRSDDSGISAPILQPQENHIASTLEAPIVSVGGAIDAIEPASIDDLLVPDVRPLRTPLVEPTPAPRLATLSNSVLPEVRDPTLFERVRDAIVPPRDAADE